MDKELIKKELELKCKGDWYNIRGIEVNDYGDDEVEIIFFTHNHWTDGSYYYSYKGSMEYKGINEDIINGAFNWFSKLEH